ncbi:anoctamin-7-like isoform X8 [Bolinopsis microptera]|uniref:anoctamin-7-like isoform X8 n=1 Tax=Bolinopsis microptera TaxID=2820187 RepID=UPI00307A7598
MSRVSFEGGGYTACPEELVEMTEEPGEKKVRKKVREAVTELDLLAEDVDRKVAQGLCVLVSPIKYWDDDEEADEEELEKEDLRTRFKRKLVGKMKGDKAVMRGGHIKDVDVPEDNLRYTLAWYDDYKLFAELDMCRFSMPLNLEANYASSESSDSSESEDEENNGSLNLLETIMFQIEDEGEEGIIDKITSFFETDQEVDYISAPFRWDKKELFAGIEDPDTFFRSSLRSFLTHHILIRTDVSKKKDTSDGINIRAGNTQTKGGMNSLGLNYLKLKGVYTDVFILHDRPSTLHRRKAFKEEDEDSKVVDPRAELWSSWKLWYKFQPLWKIRNYFGEKIAFYFAWIELYILTLIVPTIFGIVSFIYGISYSGKGVSLDEENVTTALYNAFTIFNNPLTPWFSLALCIWGTLFVEQWKRRSNSLKYEWDVSNFEQLEPDRPQFYGSKTRKNPITEEEEWYYPFYRLYLKISFSVLTIAFMVFLVMASTVGVIVFRTAFNAGNYLASLPVRESYETDAAFEAATALSKDNNALYTSVLSSVLNALAIMFLGFVYEKLAYMLTNWENHRTQTAYDDALIIKLFAFQFVNNYASLIYIAFFKEDVSENGMFGMSSWKDTCGYEDSNGRPLCYPMLVMQVAVLMILKPMPKFFKDVVIPILLTLWAKFRNKDSNDNIEAVNAGPEKTKELIDIIEEDRKLLAGDTDFTLSEYTEKCIMYGIIMLFGTVFPLAPLVALICNMVDVRVDGYRILWKNRRYIAQRAEDIGIWQYILEFLNMVGVVVNSLILAFTLKGSSSILFKPDVEGSNINSYEPWMVAFAFEHVCFALKFIVSYVIPDVPSDVQFKMRKEQFQVNQLFEKGPTKKDSTGANGNPTV